MYWSVEKCVYLYNGQRSGPGCCRKCRNSNGTRPEAGITEKH